MVMVRLQVLPFVGSWQVEALKPGIGFSTKYLRFGDWLVTVYWTVAVSPLKIVTLEGIGAEKVHKGMPACSGVMSHNPLAVAMIVRLKFIVSTMIYPLCQTGEIRYYAIYTCHQQFPPLEKSQ